MLPTDISRAFLVACILSVASAVSFKDLQWGGLFEAQGSGKQGSENEVRYLPGYQSRLPSKHYSGYITVDQDHGRQLFYYLVVSESTELSDDLIIWLTGGPGCSSMDAFTYEHGPFTFSFKQGSDTGGRKPALSDITLSPNPHSWAHAASVLYIDSPAGTGFSYSQTQEDYHTDDHKTIDDLEMFTRSFFELHPQLRQHKLYIAGESYGGVYVPLLTQRLMQHNQHLAAQTSSASLPTSEQPYNLVGYMVGNPVTDDAFDARGQVDFAYGMGLIDPSTYQGTIHTCQADGWNSTTGSPCSAAFEKLESVMGNINQYDILGSCFFHDDNGISAPLRAASAASSRSWPYAPVFPTGANTPITSMYAAAKASQASDGSSADSSSDAELLGHTISCADRRHALLYYNSPTVRRAIHADSLEDAGRWEPCSDRLHYTHTAGSMLPVHQQLLSGGLRALVLSGDHDYVVPFTGSRAWVYSLGLTETRPWHTWGTPGSKQVAGYAVQFDERLTFATVKGGGHMVPQTKPAEALVVLQMWLDGTL